MKSALRYAMFSLLMCVTTLAYEIESGSVMIFDAQEQVERVVQLFDRNQQLAINAVNSEERNPSACAVIDVAYVSGTALGVARSRSYAFEITPIVARPVASPPPKPGSLRPVPPLPTGPAANQKHSLEALICVRGFSIVYTANSLRFMGVKKTSRFDLPISVLRGCTDHPSYESHIGAPRLLDHQSDPPPEGDVTAIVPLVG
jgi:hypothetical protein